MNHSYFDNYLGQMYPAELEIKDTTKSNTSASYLALLLSIGRDSQLRTSFYDKHDDFNFHIFHHRKPLVCLSHSSYGMTGPAARDFHVSFSGWDMSWNV